MGRLELPEHGVIIIMMLLTKMYMENYITGMQSTTRGLAPDPGWHIPTDNEWSTLVNCLGGNPFDVGGSIEGSRYYSLAVKP